MATCSLCLSFLPVVGSSDRCHGRLARPSSWDPSPSSRNSAIFGRSSSLRLSTGRLQSASRGVVHRGKNVVLSMARDEQPLQKKANDMRSIEEFMPDFDELDKDELQQFLNLELESSMDFETFRHYEIMYMIHEKYADEVPVVIKKVTDFITEGKGKIYRLNDWGMRTLAYDIKKAKRANYVLMNIEISSQTVNALNTLLEKDERVIRHLVMSEKAAITEDSVPPEEYRTLRDADEGEDDDDEWDEEWDEEEGDDEEDEEEKSELVLQKE